MATGSKNERREDQAIAALLTEPTIAAAALKACVSEATLYRWLRDASFQERYRAAKRLVLEQAVAQLQQAAGDAVGALARNLTCGVPASEIAAARAILDHAFRGLELFDLADEVRRLKAGDANADEDILQ